MGFGWVVIGWLGFGRFYIWWVVFGLVIWFVFGVFFVCGCWCLFYVGFGLFCFLKE